ncbi:hypothetical protein Y461_02530 [Listeria monocytogenes]|uniref:hypothetical protein n=3 Tax=Listeria monocytogenes TaxID=1639 RepID=UPI00069C6C17|nr:hypothetical protein [Listeria monocytogenes]EAH4128681.1 hypothetical protein [Listeria monocytogenes LIS0077]EAC2211207.1 hypothetical protein [Listeria monocytogenes]EAC2616231.1 hypothetical protein [Listeria monocytogenes]EAC3208647.1 hypothetical protein [Listeria monocytogenes]EAC5046950.1 hypothetical protein [Listeria monocytogenes]
MGFVTVQSSENEGTILMKRFLVICGNQAETKYEFEEFIQSKEKYVTSVNNNEFIVELGNEKYIFTDLGNLKSFSKMKFDGYAIGKPLFKRHSLEELELLLDSWRR